MVSAVVTPGRIVPGHQELELAANFGQFLEQFAEQPEQELDEVNHGFL